MPDLAFDQAAGLRRRFGSEAGRFVGLLRPAPAREHAALLAKLAHALARCGSRVLIVDETAPESSVAPVLGLAAPNDLLNVVRHGVALETVWVEGPGHIRLLPASALARALPTLASEERRALREIVAALRRRADMVLIHADAADAGQSLVQVADEVCVVLTPSVGSITTGYTALKRLAGANPRRDYSAVVVGSADETHALAIFNNVLAAARQHLGIDVVLRGVLPNGMPVAEDVVALRHFAQMSGAVDELARAWMRNRPMVPETARWNGASPEACFA